MYQIDVDGPSSVVNVKLGGMMSVEEVAGYIAELYRICVSQRLTDSAVCLVSAEDGMSPQMARMMAAMGQAMPTQKRVLEVNGQHAAIAALTGQRQRDGSLVTPAEAAAATETDEQVLAGIAEAAASLGGEASAGGAQAQQHPGAGGPPQACGRGPFVRPRGDH